MIKHFKELFPNALHFIIAHALHQTGEFTRNQYPDVNILMKIIKLVNQAFHENFNEDTTMQDVKNIKQSRYLAQEEIFCHLCLSH